MYPITLVFKRRFTKGNLKGLTHTDTIGFVDHEAKNRWVKGIRANALAGKIEWMFAEDRFGGEAFHAYPTAKMTKAEMLQDFEEWIE